MERRALVLIRAQPHYRREAFERGLRAAGFTVVSQLPNPSPRDLVLTWNRYGASHAMATSAEAHRCPVVVVENGYYGRDDEGRQLYTLQRSMLHGYGRWYVGEGEHGGAGGGWGPPPKSIRPVPRSRATRSRCPTSYCGVCRGQRNRRAKMGAPSIPSTSSSAS